MLKSTSHCDPPHPWTSSKNDVIRLLNLELEHAGSRDCTENHTQPRDFS